MTVKYPFSHFDITREQAELYLKSTIEHIENVIIAGEWLDLPYHQLKHHDSSKFSVQEFPYNVRKYFGDKGDPAGYARSWLNHIHNNPHHWNHWIYSTSMRQDGDNCVNGCLPMPERYIREMVSDWMGASMCYTQSWVMSHWLNNNFDKIKIHPESRELLLEILGLCGYYYDGSFVHTGSEPTGLFFDADLYPEHYELVPYLDW